MSDVRILVFSKSGALLADVQSGPIPNDVEANFRGILSIIEPISVSEPSFLFSMKLGSLIVDVSFDFELYVFSITSSKTRSSLLPYNQIFSYSALICFNNLISDLPNKSSIPKTCIDSFQSMIPSDPLNKVSKAIGSLLTDSIDYIALVAQRHRVALSYGETKIPPDQFILDWCSALEAIEFLNSETPYVTVPEHENIAIIPFFPCLNSIVFFKSKATKDRVEFYLDGVNKAKKNLINLFKSNNFKPQMPQGPKKEAGRRKPAKT
ncbi:hypothetical protein M9Y10_043488 [Tritrichomonas musculus]|uniref:FUZ/MON1/HPS1 first Longin domain-containing protein n=1 Tax=Tritrichomonas musculus TaxID=1915356 RepID=A0ABR2JZW5_9EUKA